jgi:hypothetical protein
MAVCLYSGGNLRTALPLLKGAPCWRACHATRGFATPRMPGICHTVPFDLLVWENADDCWQALPRIACCYEHIATRTFSVYVGYLLS